MLTKLLITIFTIVQNQELHGSIEELARLKKESNLSQLITILSIFSITVVILLIMNLVKNHKLKAEIKRLKNQ